LSHKFQKHFEQLEKELAGNGDALLSVVRQQVCNIPVWVVISNSDYIILVDLSGLNRRKLDKSTRIRTTNEKMERHTGVNRSSAYKKKRRRRRSRRRRRRRRRRLIGFK
jgi:hypothetical protein